MKEVNVDLSIYNHENLCFSYNESTVLSSDVESLLDGITTLISGGRILVAGETIEFCSAILKLSRDINNRLILQELDMSGVAGNFIDEVSNSLAMVRSQKFALESIGQLANANFATIRQWGIHCERLQTESEFFLSRSEPDGLDSGIFVGCLDENHNHNLPNNQKKQNLHSMICEHPVLIPFLGIPCGFIVVFENSSPKRILDAEGTEVPIDRESFLGRWMGIDHT